MVFHGETQALRDFVVDPNFPNEITKTAKRILLSRAHQRS
jgi:hypothetical protein